MKIDLSNKTILVTGANSGIGNAIAQELLNAGAKVALHFNSNSDGASKLKEQFSDQCAINLEDETWIKNWNTIMNINLLATGVLSKKALQHFKTRNGGRIINIASRAAFRGDTPDYLAYAASKAGMVALIRSIARGFGKDGITAFSIAPGFTRTAMAQKSIDKYGEDFVIKDIALNELTEPKDIAPIVTLICSGKFDHGTGSNIDINAGSYVR